MPRNRGLLQRASGPPNADRVEVCRFDQNVPGRRRDLAVGATHDSRDRYFAGAGPRAFFEYRDTGTRAATDERIHIHVVHATGTAVEEGTGWHYHTMAQWFMVLDGAADIRIEDGPRKHLNHLVATLLRH